MSTGPKKLLAERKRRKLIAVQKDRPPYIEEKDNVRHVCKAERFVVRGVEQDCHCVGDSGMSGDADDVLSLDYRA